MGLENQKKKRGRPPKKNIEKKDYSDNKNIAPSAPISSAPAGIEEAVAKAPVIRTLSQGLVEITEAFNKLEQKTTQLVEERVNKTEQQLSKLAEAVGQLAEIATRGAGQMPSSSANTGSGAPTSEGNNSPAASLGAQDKLMYWGSLLARLAELGKSQPQPSAPPPTATEEGLAKGFNLMMGVITKLMEVQSTFRKNFLDEIRDTFTVFPKVLKENPKAKKSGGHIE